MTENSKPSAPFIPTDKLETLARELFNGTLPKLPADGMKRRAMLAREFAAAHLTVPGVAKPDAAKLAALAPAFRAIAANRQVRVDTFLAALPQPLTARALRDKLVVALGEQALQVKLLHSRHAVAAALTLLDALEQKDTKLDLLANPVADGGRQFLARLDAAFGTGASAALLPKGPLNLCATWSLLADLCDSVTDSKCPQQTPAAVAQRPPATAPAKPAPKAAGPMKRRDFDTLSDRAKMDFIKRGGQLTD